MLGKRFLGLKGGQLNMAIGIIAGLDFLYVSLSTALTLMHTNKQLQTVRL